MKSALFGLGVILPARGEGSPLPRLNKGGDGKIA
jgi:hypothetical protein